VLAGRMRHEQEVQERRPLHEQQAKGDQEQREGALRREGQRSFAERLGAPRSPARASATARVDTTKHGGALSRLARTSQSGLLGAPREESGWEASRVV
jgi:hypothetical protein